MISDSLYFCTNYIRHIYIYIYNMQFGVEMFNVPVASSQKPHVFKQTLFMLLNRSWPGAHPPSVLDFSQAPSLILSTQSVK